MAKQTAGKRSKALVPWAEKFAGYAQQAREQVKNIGGGVGIKFGRGSIIVGGLPIKGGKLECVVIGSCALNAWWEADYDKDDVQPPDCYALGVIYGDPELAPHEKAETPQADLCKNCDKNQFGTSKTGRGKACANCVRLGVITAKEAANAEDVPSAQLAVGRVSPTNVKHWAAYVKLLEEEHGRPPWGVVTEISSFDDPDTQIRLEFRMVELIEDGDVCDALELRANNVQDTLQQPYGSRIERAKKPTTRAGVGRKFAPTAGKGKVGRR